MSEELLSFVNKLYEQSIELLRGVKFNGQAERLIICTYASMIELAGGIIILVQKDHYSALQPVFRSFLEAYVEFVNFWKDPLYLNSYNASHHHHWRRVLSGDDDGEPNQYLAAIHAHQDRAVALARHTTELEELKKKNYKPLTVKERFARADLLDEHASIYHFESDGVHNSLGAMIERHFELQDGRLEVTLYKERSLSDYMSRLDSTAGLLMDATEKVHERFKSERSKEVQALRQELERLRARYPKEDKQAAK